MSCCGGSRSGSGSGSTIAFASLQGTVTNVAISLVDFGFTQDEVDAARKAYIFINSNALRIDWSGNTPTTTTGAIVTGYFELSPNTDIQQLRMIRDGATDAEVFVLLEE